MSQAARQTSWTASALMEADLPPPRWAVDGLFPEGLTMFCGAPKIGKSWFALELGIALATDEGRALGRLEVEHGEVLYLALEDSARRLQDRLRKLLRGETAPDRLHIELEWERFDVGGLERLDDWLAGHPDTRAVIIDVWTKVRTVARDNRDRYQQDFEAAAAVQALAIEHGVAIIALYHTRKEPSDDFVDTISGTQGLAGAADALAVVKRSRGDADATLLLTGRDVVDAELALRFSPATCAWELLGDAADYGLAKTRRAILALIDTHGQLRPKQVSQLDPAISHDLAKKTMARMHNAGQLKSTNGVYTSVSAVPLSPSEGTEGQERQGEPESFRGAYREPDA